MTKTEDTASCKADGWEEVFDRNRLVPPPSQTVRQVLESHFNTSRGFQLTLHGVAAAHLPQETKEEQNGPFQLRVTLFDRNHQYFFGKTWKSSQQRMENKRISFNEVLYFHTSLLLPSTMLVIELVSFSPTPDGSHQALGRGFTVLELFTSRPEAGILDGDRRLTLYYGSPRTLFHPLLKDTSEYGRFLQLIDGANLNCVVKNHPALFSMMHLLPENVLVSGYEDIPGLAASPAGDALLRPQLLKMLPFTLNRLTISLQPSLEKFESQLLQLINVDCHNTKQPEPESAHKNVTIQERRLHVGVHNGWCFLDKPQVVVLESLTSGFRGQTDSTSRRSTPSKNSSAASLLPQTLGLRSSLELKLAEHKTLAIIFQLEYVFSAPIGRETMLPATSTSRAAFLQCLRWGSWCPFQEPADWRQREIQLVLRGGAQPNPHAVMVYSTKPSAKSPGPASSPAPGPAQELSGGEDVISFWLTSSVEVKASSPKPSLRTKQEEVPHQRRSPATPSRGSGRVLPSSPPESPQGPGLSLSQLAATSRHPTISHSSSALPWQQSFPSLLHPSPLASAHQLSHVAYSANSSIVHLEMDLSREDESCLIHDEGEQLQELPFTPVHAPVITLGTNVPCSGAGSSRSSLAHLFSAGFPDIVDSSGQVAEVLDPTECLLFDPKREEADLHQENLLVFHFLAFTRIPTLGAGPDWPENIYLTFQFYRFPPVTSQQLKLLKSEKVQHKAGEPLPCILATHNKDGTINTGSPGLQVQFRVDDSFLKPGEKGFFLRYLARHTMHIDIWDSDSLLLIGSTAIRLEHMLRQGKSAVQALHEADVLTTDYVGEDTLLTGVDAVRHTAGSHMTIHAIVRGRLHIRTGNVGCPVDPGRRGRPADVLPPHPHIITPSKINSGFRGGTLFSRNILHPYARNAAQPDRVERDGTVAPEELTPIGEEEVRRKLNRMNLVQEREAREASKNMSKEALQVQELHQSKPSEERSKAEAIDNMLIQAMTTHHLLYASLGSAEYLEFVLRNPLSVAQTVTIHSDSPELSVITTTEEWRHFKALAKTPTPLEENLFYSEDGAPGPRVYLRPNETVHIPLKYQSFICDQTVSLQGPSFLPTGRGSQVAKKNPSNTIFAKSIKVTFTKEDGKPMAICQVNVEPTPHVVDQTFRLYHPELCFLKKAIRLPPWHNPAEETRSASAYLSVRCSDPNVICQTRMLAPGEPQDVYLKVPGSPSPHIKMFFVIVFTDEWMAAPSQIWQIYVHFLERVDVSCVTGQRSCQSVILRGRQAVRKVKCFSSHPREIEVDPSGVFVLPPAAVQELQLKVQPWQAGSRFLYVNAVDMEQRRLVTAWLLCLNVHRPILSKAFEVCVPVGRGRGSSRKITYTNPYTSERSFLLRSDHPDLLQFREDKFQIGGGETHTIGLRFAPSQSPGSVEILVYVNNTEEKTEETFCVKVSYV